MSIGAVRIVNGRLLEQEVFEQLVDPRRAMSPEASRITGIEASMLENQPTIDKVLPAFATFCEDTVLVAHNAAFDMRFLHLKEEATGVRFTQPVLDTLLLSAVLHPELDVAPAGGDRRADGRQPDRPPHGARRRDHDRRGLPAHDSAARGAGHPDAGRGARAASQKTYFARIEY